MEILSNYLFAILQPFSKDGWKIVSLISFIFIFKNWYSWKKDKLILSIFFFLLYGIILSLFSEYRTKSFEVMSNYSVGWFFSFLLGYSIIKTSDKINLLKVYVFVFMFTIFAGFLAYFHFIPDQIGFLHLVEENERLIVFDGGPELGARCNFIIIPLFVLYLFYKENKKSYIFLAVALYFIYALLLSGTRNCYISLFITLLFISFFYIYKSKKFLKTFLILLLLLFCFSLTYLFSSNVKHRINKTDIKTDYSLSSRLEMYKLGLNLIKEKPLFGHAPKTSIYRQENINHLQHFHNIYLDILVDFGFIGFILFLIIIYRIFARLIIMYIKTKSPLPLMLIFAWISIMISESFDSFLKTPYCSGLFFWATGLVLNADNSVGNNENYDKQIKKHN